MTEPQRYTKKPVTISALQWDGTVEGATSVIDWMLDNGGDARYHCNPPEGESCSPEAPHMLRIRTLEGHIDASPMDFIIQGIKGEFYPCKPDIFQDSYDKGEAPSSPGVPGLGVQYLREL